MPRFAALKGFIQQFRIVDLVLGVLGNMTGVVLVALIFATEPSMWLGSFVLGMVIWLGYKFVEYLRLQRRRNPSI